jgi:hypothetical protein
VNVSPGLGHLLVEQPGGDVGEHVAYRDRVLKCHRLQTPVRNASRVGSGNEGQAFLGAHPVEERAVVDEAFEEAGLLRLRKGPPVPATQQLDRAHPASLRCRRPIDTGHDVEGGGIPAGEAREERFGDLP